MRRRDFIKGSALSGGILLVGGHTPTYDADGDLTSDTNQSYTWDADGDMLTAGSTTVTYDAISRAVEIMSGSNSYTQIVYGPQGNKLALMSGQSLTKAFVGPTLRRTILRRRGRTFHPTEKLCSRSIP